MKSASTARRLRGKAIDRFIAGFLRLVGFAAYGFKSLVEFLPGTAGRFVRYVVSFLPRMPKTSVGL